MNFGRCVNEEVLDLGDSGRVAVADDDAMCGTDCEYQSGGAEKMAIVSA